MSDFLNTYIKSERVEISAHSFIFRKSEQVRFLHFIESGRVKLSRDTLEGKQIITYVAKPGDFLAEASLFETNYHCDAITTESTVVLKYLRHEVIHYINSKPEVALDFIKSLSHQVRDLRKQLEVINVITAKDRVMLFIKSKAEKGVFLIPGSIKNLAAQIGLAHETLYRQLKRLEVEGHISRTNKEIKILRYDSGHIW